jgi:hypothetical protein
MTSPAQQTFDDARVIGMYFGAAVSVGFMLWIAWLVFSGAPGYDVH